MKNKKTIMKWVLISTVLLSSCSQKEEAFDLVVNKAAIEQAVKDADIEGFKITFDNLEEYQKSGIKNSFKSMAEFKAFLKDKKQAQLDQKKREADEQRSTLESIEALKTVKTSKEYLEVVEKYQILKDGFLRSDPDLQKEEVRAAVKLGYDGEFKKLLLEK